MNALFDLRRNGVRRSMDVEAATPEELRSYIYELEHLLDAVAEPADAAAMLKSAFPAMTPKLAAMLAILSDGRIHSKENMLARLYAGQADDPPELKIVDVFLCKLRRAVAPFGIAITTHWAAGMQIMAGREAVADAMRTGEAPPRADTASSGPRIGKPPHVAPVRRDLTAADQALKFVATRTKISLNTEDAGGKTYLAGGEKASRIEVSSRQFAAEAATTVPFATVVRRLEELGYLTVHAAPGHGKRRFNAWSLAMTAEGIAAARARGFAIGAAA